MTINEKHLEHVGVLGMKWGHRKGSSSNKPEYRLKREGNKTIAVTKSGRKVPIANQAKVKRELYKLREKKMRDISNKAMVVGIVASVLGVVGTIALDKYTHKRFGPVPNPMGMTFGIGEGPISAVGTVFDPRYRS